MTTPPYRCLFAGMLGGLPLLYTTGDEYAHW